MQAQYLLENPFIDGEDIHVSINWLQWQDGRNFMEVVFEIGMEKYTLSPLGVPSFHEWDSLETIAAAVSFARYDLEEARYDAEEQGLALDTSPWESIFECLPSEESELQEYNWTLVD